MKMFDTCIQVRLIRWQSSVALKWIDRSGIAEVFGALRVLTWGVSISAAIMAIVLINALVRYSAATDPSYSVLVMMACLVTGTVCCWAWSSAWGLAGVAIRSRHPWALAQAARSDVVFHPRLVWEFRVLNLLMDPVSLSALRQKSLAAHTPVVHKPDNAAPIRPARF